MPREARLCLLRPALLLGLIFLAPSLWFPAQVAAEDRAQALPDDPAARALHAAMLESLRDARSLSWKGHYRFAAGGQEGRCRYRIWLKKPGFGRLEATAPDRASDAGDIVTREATTGVIVGDGETFWIYWPPGFPGTRPWDAGVSGEPNVSLYMQRNFAPARYSFGHDVNLLGSCMVMQPLDPSVFHGQGAADSDFERAAAIGTTELDGRPCDGIVVSVANGARTFEYWIGRDDRIPRRIRAVVHHAQEIVVEETWEDVRLDEEIPDSLFRWAPGEGMSEYIEPQTESFLLAEGSDAPDFRATSMDGATIRLSDLRGKVVLLNFWRISCPPCRRGLPVLEQLHRRLRGDGLIVLGYDESDDPTRLRDFLRKSGVTYPCILDTSVVGSRFRLGYSLSETSTADPLTYVIGRDGKVVSRWFGFSESRLHDGLRRAGLHP